METRPRASAIETRRTGLKGFSTPKPPEVEARAQDKAYLQNNMITALQNPTQG